MKPIVCAVVTFVIVILQFGIIMLCSDIKFPSSDAAWYWVLAFVVSDVVSIAAMFYVGDRQ